LLLGQTLPRLFFERRAAKAGAGRRTTLIALTIHSPV
jgi:hypothetical protein